MQPHEEDLKSSLSDACKPEEEERKDHGKGVMEACQERGGLAGAAKELEDEPLDLQEGLKIEQEEQRASKKEDSSVFGLVSSPSRASSAASVTTRMDAGCHP